MGENGGTFELQRLQGAGRQTATGEVGSTCRPRGCAAGAAANADAQSISGGSGSDCSDSGSDFVDGVGGKHEISHSQTLFHEHKV